MEKSFSLTTITKSYIIFITTWDFLLSIYFTATWKIPYWPSYFHSLSIYYQYLFYMMLSLSVIWYYNFWFKWSLTVCNLCCSKNLVVRICSIHNSSLKLCQEQGYVRLQLGWYFTFWCTRDLVLGCDVTLSVHDNINHLNQFFCQWLIFLAGTVDIILIYAFLYFQFVHIDHML